MKPLNSNGLALINLGDHFFAMIPPGKVVNLSELMQVKKLYWQSSPKELKHLFGTVNPLKANEVDFCNDPMTKCVSSIWEINGVFYCAAEVL